MFGRFKRGDDPVKDLSQMAVLSMTSSLWVLRRWNMATARSCRYVLTLLCDAVRACQQPVDSKESQKQDSFSCAWYKRYQINLAQQFGGHEKSWIHGDSPFLQCQSPDELQRLIEHFRLWCCLLRLACDVRPRALTRHQSTKPREVTEVKKKALGSAFSKRCSRSTGGLGFRTKEASFWMNPYHRWLLCQDTLFPVLVGIRWNVSSRIFFTIKGERASFRPCFAVDICAFFCWLPCPYFKVLSHDCLQNIYIYTCDGGLKYFPRRARAETHALRQLILQDCYILRLLSVICGYLWCCDHCATRVCSAALLLFDVPCLFQLLISSQDGATGSGKQYVFSAPALGGIQIVTATCAKRFEARCLLSLFRSRSLGMNHIVRT